MGTRTIPKSEVKRREKERFSNKTQERIVLLVHEHFENFNHHLLKELDLKLK